MDYIDTDEFWDEYHISVAQFKCDISYLYGLLKSATKQRVNPYLVMHRHDKDGLLVWQKFQQNYAYGGSKRVKSEELEEQVFKRYDPREYNGMVDYIDRFQAWMEELDALGIHSYDNSDKKRLLLRNLKSDIRLLSLIQICQDDLLKDFDTTANYLRENGISMDMTLKKHKGTTSQMLTSTKESKMEMKTENSL